MLGNIARMLVAAGLISGLCSPVLANTTADGADDSHASVPVIQLQGAGVEPPPATDAATPKTMDEEPPAVPIAEPVDTPVVTTRLPPVRIALLLPLRSDALMQVADAVRAGFMAGYQYDPANIVVNLVATGDAAQDVLSGYLDAAASNDIVVGPLTRSGATVIVQNATVGKPTIVLTQLNAAGDAEVAVPSNVLVMGLSIEDEARQVADWAAHMVTGKAFAITTNVAWQRRAERVFVAQWRQLGMQSDAMELNANSNSFSAAALAQLKKRMQTEKPAMIFVALDAAQASQLRQAIGPDVAMYGTSQLNPLTLADWAGADRLTGLDGVHLVDMPWQLQADDAAVMAYPHLPAGAGQHHSPDIERLYALGIDAYRVARNIAIGQSDFTVDGVTGKLTIHFGGAASHFDRIMQPAAYLDGRVQPLQTP